MDGVPRHLAADRLMQEARDVGSGGEFGKQGPAQAPEFAGTCRGERLPRAARSSADLAPATTFSARAESISTTPSASLSRPASTSIGDGWSLNLGVKKTWLDTTVTWYNNDALGGVNVVNDDDVDPWIFSARVGYRFNLGDAFGRQA